MVGGDLGQKVLEDLAARVTVEGGEPQFSPLAGYAAAAVILFDPPLVREMRYSTDDLGEAGIRGSGLIYTGVTPGASFETSIFEAHGKRAGVVRGKPVILSEVPSGWLRRRVSRPLTAEVTTSAARAARGATV